MPGTACYDWLLSVSNVFVAYGADLMVQSTIVVGLGLGAAFLLGRKSALLQNLLLKGILLAVLLCPFLSIVMRSAGFEGVTVRIPAAVMPFDRPDAGVVVPPREGGTGEHDRIVAPEPASGLYFPATAYDSLRPLVIRLEERFSRIDPLLVVRAQLRYFLPFAYLLFGVGWMVLTFAMASKIIFYIVRIIHFRKTGEIPPRKALILNRIIARRLLIDPPLILESEYVTSPFLCGVLNPVILIPVGFDVTDEILIHEHAHLVRRDCMWKLLLEIACAMYPFQPLMRMLTRAIEFTDDYVCDDYVVRLTRNPRMYAEQLYSVASRYRVVTPDSGIGACFVTMRGSLKRRIERILVQSGQLIVKPGVRMIFGVATVSIVCAMIAGTVDFIGELPVPVVADGDSPETMARPDEVVAVDDTVIETTGQKKADGVKRPDVSRREPQQPPLKQPVMPMAAFLEIPDVEFAFDELDIEVHGEVDESLESFDVIKDYYTPNTGDNDSAQDMYPQEMRYDPDRPAVLDIDPEALENMDACKKAGRELLNLGSWEKAERVLCRAMEFDSEDHEVRYLLGQVYNGKRETDLAILYFKLAIALKSDYALAYYDLGKTYQARGEPDQAWDYYRVAIDLNPALSRTNGRFILN